MVDSSVKKTMIAAPTCMSVFEILVGDGRVMKNRRSFNEGKDGLGTFQ